MTKNKTTYTEKNVFEFIEEYADSAQKKADSLQLIELMREFTGEEPRMWGPSIIGFGNYQYKYASGHAGEAPVIGFSPRKNALTLYVFSDTPKSQIALETLGIFKMSKACIYIKRLSDIHLPSLKMICLESVNYISEHYECSCRKQ